MSKRGFTLIELLVVISIISLLSSIVLASLNNVRSKARDAKRLGDLRAMNTALQLYASDHNGSYPCTGPCNSATWKCSDCNNSGGYLDAAFFTTNFVTPGYMSIWPTDPTPTASRPNGGVAGYLYLSDGTNYKILVYLTVENPSMASSLADPHPYSNSWSYYTPGTAAGW